MKAKKTHYLIFSFILTIIITFCFFSCSPASSAEQLIEESAQGSIEESFIIESGEETSGDVQVYVGLRRSNYGAGKLGDGADEWWVDRAKEYAASLASSIEGLDNVQPVIIQIVSGYNRDGTTNIGFEKPHSYTGPTENITFSPNRRIDHEHSLATYDEHGVKAIIQFEPGNSDVLTNLELAHQALGHHECIIGYGVDAEWYFTRESTDLTGKPVKDEDARKWMEKVLSFDSTYTLFIKHWEPAHTPRSYRHPNLWFLSDCQEFSDLDSLIDNFEFWADSHEGQTVGYQYGYPRDREWWGQMSEPTNEIAQRILSDIPETRYLFWVDFTADEVDFY
ncbi:MAG TPA: hypothetical protein DCP02_06925 [Actinobacteria bacterium]|nr:hypothetical protein [Actinomycetota bacterium]